MSIHATAAGGGFVDFSKALTDVYVQKRFIAALKKKFRAVPVCKVGELPEKNGKKVRWLYLDLSALTAVTAIGEAGVGAQQDFTLVSKEATLAEYGGYSEYTKFLNLTAISGTVDEISDAVGYHAALSFDTRVLVQAGSGSPQTVDAGAALNAEAMRQTAAKLDNKEAMRHPMSNGGETFLGLFTTNAAYDMFGEGAPTFFQTLSRDVWNHMRRPLDPSGNAPDIYGIEVKTTNNIQVDASSPVNELMYVFGANAIGCLSMAVDAVQPRVIIHRPSERVDLPLENKGTIGWWGLFEAAPLDTNRYVQVLADQ